MCFCIAGSSCLFLINWGSMAYNAPAPPLWLCCAWDALPQPPPQDIQQSTGIVRMASLIPSWWLQFPVRWHLFRGSSHWGWSYSSLNVLMTHVWAASRSDCDFLLIHSMITSGPVQLQHTDTVSYFLLAVYWHAYTPQFHCPVICCWGQCLFPDATIVNEFTYMFEHACMFVFRVRLCSFFNSED